MTKKYLMVALLLLMLSASALRAATYWTDDIETNKGWTFSGNAQQTWARGTPVGGSGTGPDPVGAYQGTYCIGNNMTAVGSYASSETSFAVSPAINCTGSAIVYLHFYRWLCTKGSSNTQCSLAVSNNGTTWTGIFGNPNPALDDAAWQYLTYDISAVAANQATVYLRFRLKDSGANPPRHGGWNIDNVTVDNNPLAVSLSSFDCLLRDGAVMLSWRTESENDCYQWQIERSVEQEKGYAVIGSVPGHGTSSEAHSYTFTDTDLKQAGIYYYRLTEQEISGSRTSYGPVMVTFRAPSISAFQAGSVWPNPVRDRATVSLQLPRQGTVMIAVYNLAGQKVRTLADGMYPAGPLIATWDGRDGQRQRQPSGVYLIKALFRDAHGAGGEQSIVKRLILAR